MRDFLLDLLLDLDGVRQDPRHHPEGDALFHALQVFDLARRDTRDADLLAAALFHDVGKAIDPRNHEDVGADALDGVLSRRAVWLVRRHMDLLRDPRGARQMFHGTSTLRDLEQLRRWDLRGRNPRARTLDPVDALDLLLDHPDLRALTGDDAHDQEID